MPLQELESFENVSPAVLWAMLIVGGLIVLVAAVSLAVSLWLMIKYVTYNRRKNTRGLTGQDAARMILDNHGLGHIKVSTFGSMLFGNSYSHYFKKVRLRRLTTQKASITSLAMGAEKSALAILDKEGDKDMRTRVVLTPLMYLGPLAVVPLLLIGVIVDILFFRFSGVVTLVAAILSLALFAVAFVLSIMTLKTEKKAQDRACLIMAEQDMATAEEIETMRELFRLYNIQYVNDIILEFLQLIMRVLQLVAKLQQSSASSKSR
ncbi:MAG: zinc metallopeptidase [Clostridia bacterium]|nr:zinc metallopeptidase [Clostridia bacterium]